MMKITTTEVLPATRCEQEAGAVVTVSSQKIRAHFCADDDDAKHGPLRAPQD